MIIGRSDPYRNHNPEIDLSTIDIKNSVSRAHAEIYRDDDGWLIRDIGSLNGTKLNGRRLTPNMSERISPLDECVFGAIAFRFVDGKLKQIL